MFEILLILRVMDRAVQGVSHPSAHLELGSPRLFASGIIPRFDEL